MFTMKFENYKSKFEDVINSVINEHFDDQTKYDSNKAQEWINVIVKEVVKKAHESGDFKGYKVICTASLIQKAGCCMHFAGRVVYNPMCDGNTMVRFENEFFNFFLCLYAVIN